MGVPSKDELMDIEQGTPLEATTCSGEVVRMRALGPPMQGRDFPVVWVCTEQEYERACADGDGFDGLPWPLEDVKVPEPA